MSALLRNGPFDGKVLDNVDDNWKAVNITGVDSKYDVCIYRPSGKSQDGHLIFDYEGVNEHSA